MRRSASKKRGSKKRKGIIESHGFPFKKCRLFGCSEPAELTCKDCHVAYYCCPGHQKADWEFHEKLCPIIRFIESQKCPITKAFHIDPVRNANCGHTYERAAIAELLQRNSGVVLCPHGTCGRVVYSNVLNDDLFVKRIILDFFSLLEHRQKPWVHREYVKDPQLINRKSVYGALFSKDTVFYVVRVRYIGSMHMNKKELYFKFDDKLVIGRVIQQFLNMNNIDGVVKVEDCVVTCMNNEVDTNCEAGLVGIKEGTTLFVHFHSDEELEEEFRIREALKEKFREATKKLQSTEEALRSLELKNTRTKLTNTPSPLPSYVGANLETRVHFDKYKIYKFRMGFERKLNLAEEERDFYRKKLMRYQSQAVKMGVDLDKEDENLQRVDLDEAPRRPSEPPPPLYKRAKEVKKFTSMLRIHKLLIERRKKIAESKKMEIINDDDVKTEESMKEEKLQNTNILKNNANGEGEGIKKIQGRVSPRGERVSSHMAKTI